MEYWDTDRGAPVPRAFAMARLAHGSQVRKYGGEPYYRHPWRVATSIMADGYGPDYIIPAALHDVLEDCGYLWESEILDRFGAGALKVVRELTDVYTKEKYPELNRAERKAEEAERIRGISLIAATIKIYDTMDNLGDIVVLDPKFALTFAKEKMSYLDSLPDCAERTRLSAVLYSILAGEE